VALPCYSKDFTPFLQGMDIFHVSLPVQKITCHHVSGARAELLISVNIHSLVLFYTLIPFFLSPFALL